jgi:heparin/heparan-sulfate lyase
VEQVTRTFVILKLRTAQVPAAMVVCDRVVSADPGFRKYWLLHTQEEPHINGASALVDCTQHGQRGRLTLDVLLPAGDNRQLTGVGGPGKEYWVFGTNHANDIEPRQLERSSLEPGAWRIEISPKAAADEDLFLTVMQVTDRTAPGRLPVRLVELPDRVGAFIERPDGSRFVLFRRDARRSSWPVTIEVPGPGTTGVLVTDLTPGVWRVRRVGEAASREIHVSQELGAAWFEASPGTWNLEISTP